MESKTRLPPHYECLGVDPCISSADLARQYKKLSLQLHPDRAAYRGDAANEAHVQERYQRITEAYAVLSDPEKRRAYDTKHGVNFQLRLVRLQTAIGEHNTLAMQRTEMGSKTAYLASRSSPTGDPHGAEHTDDDDDDEDYDPNDVLVPPCGAPRHVSSSGFHSDSSCEHEQSDYITQLFNLHLRVGAEAVPKTRQGMPVTQYQTVVLTRKLSSPASPYACTWGFIFEKNELVDLDTEYPEELKGITGLAAVPFPSVVLQVNDIMVLPTTDLPQLLSRLYKGNSPQISTVSPATGKTTPTSDDAHSDATEKRCNVHVEPPIPSLPSPSTEHLHLVLAYSTVSYDLVGQVHLLGDDDVVGRLVPSWCVAPQLRPLMPDATVLSVNNKQVRSAAELRASLRATLLDVEGKDAMQVVKRARTSCAVLVEFCQLPFLCSSSSREHVPLPP